MSDQNPSQAGAVPQIFSPARRSAAFRRAKALQAEPQATDFLYRHIAGDIAERIAFMRLRPARALVIGDFSAALAPELIAQGASVESWDNGSFAEDQPWPVHGFDLIAMLIGLASINDVAGALIHMRHALAAGGIAIVSFPGAGSLPRLRAALMAADGARPAARLHPQIDARSGAELMRRAGFSRQVVDSYSLKVRYASLARLVEDHRAQGLANMLASPPPPLSRAALAQAEAAFMEGAKAHEGAKDKQPRTEESYEIVTLTGWK